jgi:pimeloyl-ACP methyl ester carboxylesterase
MVGIPHTVLVLFVATVLTTSGCYQKRLPATPIPVKYYESGNSPSTTLLVLLPGIYDTIDEFENHGFIDTVHHSEQPCDLVSVDAHYGYYDAGTIVERLRNDVIIPAQQAGYSDIRIVGISLGGFGALLYANRYSTEVNTLVLLAPWLGNEKLIDSITAADGLENWQPTDMLDEQPLENIWLQRKKHATTITSFPRLYLGYGTVDKFRPAHTLFAGTLPDAHIFTIAGGHNWSSWKNLWEQMQEQDVLCD